MIAPRESPDPKPPIFESAKSIMDSRPPQQTLTLPIARKKSSGMLTMGVGDGFQEFSVMTGSAKARSSKASRAPKSNLDLDPDAWPKFEALIKSAAKLGHKPHVARQTVGKSASARKRAPSAAQ